MYENKSDRTEMSCIWKALFIIFSLLLLYEYYYTTTPAIVIVDNPHFSLLDPYNVSNTVEVKDVYNQLMDLSNFSFKVNPQPCEDYQAGILLVVIVSSNPVNYEKRKVIRSTWGRSIDSTQVVFLMGESDNSTISEQIANESLRYGDIVQGSFKDVYRNMTYKHIMGLKWVTHHCPMAKYVLKTDDDVLVHSHALRNFLARELSPWGARGLIMCQVLVNARVQRSEKSKWKVSTEEYMDSYYPTYCPGWAILYSPDVVSQLLIAAQSAPYFWIDDVFVTGILAEKIHVPRTPLSTLILSWNRVELLTLLGSEYVGPFLFGPPDLSTDKITQIWKSIPI